MSKNKINRSLAGKLKDMEEGLSRLQKSHTIGRHRTVMLENSVEILNLTSQSTTSWTDLDLSGYTSSGTGDLSDNAIAVIVLAKMRDSASATTNISLRLRKNGSATADGTFIMNGSHLNSQYMNAQGIVPIDTDYVLERDIAASGAGTLDVLLYLVGYIEQLGPIT